MDEVTEKPLSREEIIRRAKRKKFFLRTVYIVVPLLLFVLLVWWGLNQKKPQGEDFSVTFADQGQDHIAEGAEHTPYNSNPPTSGPHYVQPASTGFYDEDLPDEKVVHNLEHGHIWISYKSTIPDDVKEKLKSLASVWVIITKRDANDTDIALAAWTRLDKFYLDGKPLDETRVEDFIKRYQNQGPEKVMGNPF